MPLKYANPEQAKVEAYQYYCMCVDKYARTKHNKDYAEMVRARHDWVNKANYARRHQAEMVPKETTPESHIESLNAVILELREKNKHLRRCLTLANKQLRLPVDKRDVDIVQKLQRIDFDRRLSE